MDESLHRLSKLFQALGNGIRLQLLITLQDGESDVSSLANEVNRSVNSVSHHLKILRDNNLLESRTEGKQRIYSLKRPSLLKEALSLQEFLERD
jgi:DNA-binding transcriptional ArsR family regulator